MTGWEEKLDTVWLVKSIWGHNWKFRFFLDMQILQNHTEHCYTRISGWKISLDYIFGKSKKQFLGIKGLLDILSKMINFLEIWFRHFLTLKTFYLHVEFQKNPTCFWEKMKTNILTFWNRDQLTYWHWQWQIHKTRPQTAGVQKLMQPLMFLSQYITLFAWIWFFKIWCFSWVKSHTKIKPEHDDYFWEIKYKMREYKIMLITLNKKEPTQFDPF